MISGLSWSILPLIQARDQIWPLISDLDAMRNPKYRSSDALIAECRRFGRRFRRQASPIAALPALNAFDVGWILDRIVEQVLLRPVSSLPDQRVRAAVQIESQWLLGSRRSL